MIVHCSLTYIQAKLHVQCPQQFVICVILLEETELVCEVERSGFFYVAGHIEARITNKIVVKRPISQKGNSTGVIFIAVYVNANIEIVFVFKIVITSLIPVRIDMLNIHYFYVNTILATSVPTAESECYLSILRKIKTYLRKQDQPIALFVSALIMALQLKFFISPSLKSRNLIFVCPCITDTII